MDQIPAHLQGGRRQLGQQSTEGMGAPPVPYISIEAQKFTLVDASGQTMEMPTFGPIFTQLDQAGNEVAIPGSPVGIYLDVTLVDVNEHMSKIYYAQPFSGTAQQFMPPDCWSDNGVAPSVAAMRPQSERCDICQWNVWGSKINALGNKVRACDDVKKLAWIVPALHIPTAFLLRLKGSSHRNWSSYVEKVMKQNLGQRQLDPTDLVTRIYFEPGQIGILNFHWVRLIDAETAKIEDAIWQSRATDILVGRLDKPRTLALPAPSGQGNLPNSPMAATAPPAPAFVPPPPPSQGPVPSFPTTGARQAQPFVPGAAPLPLPQPAQTAPAGTAEPRRRRRRAVEPAQAPVNPNIAAQTPFGGSVQPAATPSNEPPRPPTTFGVQPGQAAPSEVQKALMDALGPLPQ